MNKATLRLIAFVLAGQAYVFAADFSAVIEERQELMKANRAAQKALKSAAGSGDLATVEAEANKLAKQFDKIADPALFPEGSTSEKSRARTLVWEERAAFVKKATSSAAIARSIAAEAKAGKLQEVRASVNSLGKRTCTNCHTKFRKPRPIKGSTP